MNLKEQAKMKVGDEKAYIEGTGVRSARTEMLTQTDEQVIALFHTKGTGNQSDFNAVAGTLNGNM